MPVSQGCFAWILALIGVFGGLACSKAAPKPAKAGKKTSSQARELAPKPGDAVIDGCLVEYPKEGFLGGGVDPQRAWKICMVQSGQQGGLCDPANMISLATAVCIARGKGLPMASQWRARLEFSPAPESRVLWRLGLPDETAHTLIDAHTGETVALHNPPDEQPAAVGLSAQLPSDPSR